ncbi:hypothetical protein D0Z08_29580 [Nocardioides immobilis]|uniref:Uncharacterized protein n=1 Tax=Nocardioides immobilis TaxID=2049295 RepID=A0A417XTC2_9ACTN|nr:hypothetical protein [Nocardioides immobilis]RHW23467.1 hypothetical protein D0Z08_29580 [Nocardioides immobilis]
MTTDIDRRVHIVDHVVLPAAEVGPWLDRWRTTYLPGAQVRGMQHVGIAQRYAGPASVEVRVDWEVAGPYAFYGMRGQAAADPTVTRFWAETDALATSRDRSVSAAKEDDA